MKQGFLFLLCLSALTLVPSCRNKKNERREEKANKAAQKDAMRHEKKMKREQERNY
jgi:hypothetical protein